MERRVRGRRARLGLSVARDAALALGCALLATACLVPEPPPPAGDPAGPRASDPAQTPPTPDDDHAADGLQEPQVVAPEASGTSVAATDEPVQEPPPPGPEEPAEATAPAGGPGTEAQSEGPAAEPDLPAKLVPVVPGEGNGAEPAERTEPVQPTEPPEPEKPTAPEGVITLLQTYYEAMDARDWSAARECFWAGATITRLRAPAEGQPTQVLVLPASEVFRRFEAGEEGPLEGVRGGLADTPLVEAPPAVHASASVAQAWCTYAGSLKSEDGRESRWTRFDSVALVQHDQVWKIAALVQGISQDRR